MKIHRLILAASLALAAGCTAQDGPADVLAPSSPAAAARAADQSGDAQAVARAFALAMREDGIRLRVRDAMRASRVTEHKLLLQDFVRTPAGADLVQAAAAAVGTDHAELSRRIAALPPLDFYMPFREHRLAWRGTPDLALAAIFDPRDPTATAFTTGGAERSLDGRSGVPALPLMVLRPAERKSRRIDPQPDRPGEVIQEPGDGEVSGTIEWVGQDGRVRVAPLRGARPRGGARLSSLSDGESSCDDETAFLPCDPSSTFGFPLADTTFVDNLWVSYGDGWFDNSNEIELRAQFYKDGVVVARATLRQENVLPRHYYYLHSSLLPREIAPGSAEYIFVAVVETDLMDDDNQGGRRFYEEDRAQLRYIVDDQAIGSDTTKVQLDWFP